MLQIMVVTLKSGFVANVLILQNAFRNAYVKAGNGHSFHYVSSIR